MIQWGSVATWTWANDTRSASSGGQWLGTWKSPFRSGLIDAPRLRSAGHSECGLGLGRCPSDGDPGVKFGVFGFDFWRSVHRETGEFSPDVEVYQLGSGPAFATSQLRSELNVDIEAKRATRSLFPSHSKRVWT